MISVAADVGGAPRGARFTVHGSSLGSIVLKRKHVRSEIKYTVVQKCLY